MEQQVIIDRRFCGPPASANGGYAAGVIAEGIEGVAVATLRVPPPLDTPLRLISDGTESLLMNEDQLIGEAGTTTLELVVPEPPSLDEAVAASARYVFLDGGHIYPTCFVCGPDREAGDGLRVFPGPLDDSDIVAAPWTPDTSLGRTGEPVERRYVWSALDCPSYFGLGSTPIAVLGRMTAAIDRAPAIGETVIVMGWPMGTDRRKRFSGSALATPEGEVIARAAATWIEIEESPEPPIRGRRT